MKPVINSEKHIVQTTLTSVPAGTVANITLVNAKQDVNRSSPIEVSVGTVIKAIYLEYWFLGEGQQPPTMTVTFAKFPGGVAQWDATDLGNLHATANKKNILEMHQGFLGDANTNPVPMFRHWVKIPKGKQRFGISDRLILSAKSIIQDDIQFCGMAIFKAYN